MDEKAEATAGAKVHQEVLEEHGVIKASALRAYATVSASSWPQPRTAPRARPARRCAEAQA